MLNGPFIQTRLELGAESYGVLQLRQRCLPVLQREGHGKTTDVLGVFKLADRLNSRTCWLCWLWKWHSQDNWSTALCSRSLLCTECSQVVVHLAYVCVYEWVSVNRPTGWGRGTLSGWIAATFHTCCGRSFELRASSIPKAIRTAAAPPSTTAINRPLSMKDHMFVHLVLVLSVSVCVHRYPPSIQPKPVRQ